MNDNGLPPIAAPRGERLEVLALLVLVSTSLGCFAAALAAAAL